MHDAVESKVIPGRPFLSILRYNRPYLRDYALGGAMSAVYVLVGLAPPLVVRRVVQGFEEGWMAYRSLAIYFGVLVGIGLVTGVARYYQRMLMIRASRKFEYDLRNDYFRHVQRLSQRFFHRTQTGDIMARATNDLNFVRAFVGPGIMGSVDLVRLPFALGLMIYLSPRLTAIALVPLPIVVGLVYLFVMYNHRQTKRVNEEFSGVTSRAQENLAGARVVKAYGIADREIEAFRKQSTRYMWENLKLNIVMSLAWPFIGLVVGLIHLLILWRGGVMVIHDTLSLSNFSGFLVCLLMLAWPLAEFGWVLTLYQRGAAGMNRIAEIFAKTPDITDSDKTRQEITSIQGDIRMEQVSFAYNGRPVLEDLTLHIPAGSTAAIVGATGSGKSSIVGLVTREFDPQSGRVLIDGVDVREIPVRTLRDSMGYVPQDTFLFSDTVGNNVTFGRRDATRADMDWAAEVAQFTETLARLEDGYDTLLGERGVNLSGGQKQRLSIARAVIRDPRILILDDALSSVDTQTESHILRHIKDVARRRTTVLISHRTSSIQHADVIFVLDDGRLVEQGTHDTLIAEGGLYAAMHQRQLLEEALEEAQ